MELPKREGGGKNFIKLKKGESVRGVFRGKTINFDQHWIGGKGVLCEGTANCPYCKQSDKGPAYRFRVNFVINENGAYTAKIFEGSGKTYDALCSLNDELNESGQDLEKHLVKIVRQGDGNDTTYQLMPVINGALNETQVHDVASVKLLPLEKKTADAPKSEDDDAPPF